MKKARRKMLESRLVRLCLLIFPVAVIYLALQEWNPTLIERYKLNATAQLNRISLMPRAAGSESVVSEFVCFHSEFGNGSSVTVLGPGCGSCIQGVQCSFQIILRPAVLWDSILDSAVIFDGPALAAGVVQEAEYSAGRRLDVTYRLWDAGSYSAHLDIPCGNPDIPDPTPEVLTAADNVTRATWAVNVREAGLQYPSSPSPCDEGFFGRWVCPALEERKQSFEDGQQGRSMCRWTPFPCTPIIPHNLTFVKTMADRGVKEITLMGDSHQRSLIQPFVTRMAGFVPGEALELHKDLFTRVKDKEGRTLVLNYFWVDGIYTNGEYGCSERARYSNRSVGYAPFPPTSQVLLFDAGHWAIEFCKEPFAAFVSHFHKYLDWIRVRTNNTGTAVVFRTLPPFASSRLGCSRRNNLAISELNTVAVAAARHYGFQVFDGWQVEGPRYGDTCGVGETHYSCIRGIPRTRRKRAEGDVGLATADALMDFLAAGMRMP